MEEVDVLALDLTAGPPDLGEPVAGLEAHWTTTPEAALAYNAASVDIFGVAPMSQERAATVASENAQRLAGRRGAGVVVTARRAPGRHRGWRSTVATRGSKVLVWVKLDAPADLEAALQQRGAGLRETVDVLALDLSGGVPPLDPPADVDVRWQVDETTTRDALAVGVAAFDEGSVPDDARVAELAAEAAADLEAGRVASAVAYLDGRAVGAGGVTLVEGVARLWGAGVVPEARGRGVYRALLNARCGTPSSTARRRRWSRRW